jgi:hypothetical protein
MGGRLWWWRRLYAGRDGWPSTAAAPRSARTGEQCCRLTGKPTSPNGSRLILYVWERTGVCFSGPVDQLTSYPFFGVPVYAAADGTVVEATDGLAEQIPGGTLVGITVDTLPGNHIVVDMGNGNFALYAHIKTGTVAVKVGDHVKPGDVIGHLGNTGNTSAPHLHFHVMDGPSPLASNRLPYEIEGFQSAGMLQPEDSFFEKGDPGKIDRSWFPGSHQNELPLENEVVDFPGAQ